jgi:hypothetical protein
VLADPRTERQFPITIVDFADERALPLTPSFTSGQELRMAATGMVTASTCREDSTFRSGKPALWVNDEPVLALASEVPFFRDLEVGDSGRDVDSLRRALRALGFEVTRSGPFRADVIDALAALQAREELSHANGRFRVGDFLWIPDGSAEIDSCRVQVGQIYVSGDTVATTRAVLTSLSVADEATSGLVSGARSVEVFGAKLIMPDSGTLTDPASLKDVASSPHAREGLRSAGESGSPVVGTSALTVPLQVAAVPVASVFTADGTRGCVASEAATHPVRIVGARLGMSLVVFDAKPPRKVLLQPDPGRCRAH